MKLATQTALVTVVSEKLKKGIFELMTGKTVSFNGYGITLSKFKSNAGIKLLAVYPNGDTMAVVKSKEDWQKPNTIVQIAQEFAQAVLEINMQETSAKHAQPKENAMNTQEVSAPVQEETPVIKRGRGRPKGSTTKAKVAPTQEAKPTHFLGFATVAPVQAVKPTHFLGFAVAKQSAPTQEVSAPAKKSVGRPKGSKNSVKVATMPVKIAQEVSTVAPIAHKRVANVEQIAKANTPAKPTKKDRVKKVASKHTPYAQILSTMLDWLNKQDKFAEKTLNVGKIWATLKGSQLKFGFQAENKAYKFIHVNVNADVATVEQYAQNFASFAVKN